MKKYLFILVTALSINIYGQYNFTTNDIPVIPQSTYLNPALMPTCRVYIDCLLYHLIVFI